MKTVSIIIPVHNEEVLIDLFYQRLIKVLETFESKYQFEILFSNNGSTDSTLEKIKALSQKDDRVLYLTLSRNFGYQASLMGALNHISGDASIFIDVDGEDPPELIPKFLSGWEEGYDVVYGRRDSRPEFFLLQWARKLFYRLTKLISDYDFMKDMAEFSLISKRVREVVLSSNTGHPFIRADIAYAGFARLPIPYAREKRMAGKTHYNFLGMLRFAVAGILSSSTLPLRLNLYLGLPLALVNLIYAGLYFWCPNPNFWKILILIDIAFLIQQMSFAGVYIARSYKDVVRKPLFIVDEKKTMVKDNPIRGHNDRA